MTDLFDLMFKEWSRPVKEANGYTVVKSDSGYVLVINARGETKIELINFTNKVGYQFYVGDLNGKLTDVDYSLKDGFLYVDIKLKQEKPKVKIQYKE